MEMFGQMLGSLGREKDKQLDKNTQIEVILTTNGKTEK